MSDAQIREWLGAPYLRELIDRSCLRWMGHCARMATSRIPVQLLSASVPQWAYPTTDSAAAQAAHRHRTCISEALRHFGLHSCRRHYGYRLSVADLVYQDFCDLWPLAICVGAIRIRSKLRRHGVIEIVEHHQIIMVLNLRLGVAHAVAS